MTTSCTTASTPSSRRRCGTRGEPPYREVDWDVWRGHPRRRVGNRVDGVARRWWEHAAGWTRAAIPLAVAAALAAFALIASDR